MAAGQLPGSCSRSGRPFASSTARFPTPTPTLTRLGALKFEYSNITESSGAFERRRRQARGDGDGDGWSRMVLDLIAALPWPLVIMACLTLGLAPFTPEPHLVEKLRMLSRGTLRKPVDIFDLCMHGTPWAVGVVKFLFT